MTERESEKAKRYIETVSAFDFGIFNLNNLCEQNDVEPEFSELIRRQIDEVTENTVMVYFTIPDRPKDKKPLKTKYEEIDLSVAELAGVSASIALSKMTNSLFYSLQFPGIEESSWFNKMKIFETPSSHDPLLPKRQESMTEIPRGQMYYLTSDELFSNHGISLSQKEEIIDINLGGVNVNITERINVKSSSKPITRRDIHTLRGFLQGFTLWAFIKSSRSPFIYLVDKPLSPYSEIDQVQLAENIISIDRIKSYI